MKELRAVSMGPGITVFTDRPETPEEKAARESQKAADKAAFESNELAYAAYLSQHGFTIEYVPPAREGKSPTARGKLMIGLYTLTAARDWAYQRLHLDPPLPVDLAVALNDTPRAPGGATKYSGDRAVLGGVARAGTYSRGLSGDQVRSIYPGGVSNWHLDSPADMTLFLATLRTLISGAV